MLVGGIHMKLVALLMGLLVLVGCSAPSRGVSGREENSDVVASTGGEASPLPRENGDVDPVETPSWLSGGTFVDSLHGWVILNHKSVLTTGDGGTSWEEIYESPTSIGRLQFVTERIGWAIEDGQIVATEDGGRSWRTVTADGPNFSRIELVAEYPAWAVRGRTLYSSPDQGVTWLPVDDPCEEDSLGSLSFISEDVGWVICTGTVKCSFTGPTTRAKAGH